MVEFVLVVPILLILVIALGDFGRIFATGVIIESAARNAAEAAANEYLANPPGSAESPPVLLNAPAPTGKPAYYGPLHQIAAKAVCVETQELPNSKFDPASRTCAGMPFVMVCIHDSQDTHCGGDAFGASPPAQCDEMGTPPSNAHGGLNSPRWAEVRICYKFTAILELPLIAFGDFWIQRTRNFAIPCYFATGDASECG